MGGQFLQQRPWIRKGAYPSPSDVLLFVFVLAPASARHSSMIRFLMRGLTPEGLSEYAANALCNSMSGVQTWDPCSDEVFGASL